MTPIPVIWRRALHVAAGLIPLAFGIWRWHGPLSIHTFLIISGLVYTIAVVLKRGRTVWRLAEYFQAAITLMFLDLALRHVDLGDLWEVLRRLDIPLFRWGMFIWGLSIWFRGYRFFFLLEGNGQLKPRDAVVTTYISFFGNFALPARAGEILRILVLGQSTGVSKTKIGAGVALEKLSDLLALLVMVAYLVGFARHGDPTLRFFGIVGGVLSLGIVFVILAAIYLRKQLPLPRGSEDAAGRHRLRRFLHKFVDGLRPAANPAYLMKYTFHTLIAWFLYGYACYVFLQSQEIYTWLADASQVGPIASIMLLVVLINAATLIPAGPGSAGPYQASVMLGFTMLGTGASVAGSEAYHIAAAFSIVFWVGQAIPSILSGGYLFFRSGFTLNLLKSAEREAADRMIHPDKSVEGDSGARLA